jgi:cobalt/nickel transport protein
MRKSVEYLNQSSDSRGIVRPHRPYVTQVVKADKNGVFSYAMPRAGWWGAAALEDASWKLKRTASQGRRDRRRVVGAHHDMK